MLPNNYKIIDISQPLSSKSACFPGDVPCSRKITASLSENGSFNLSAITTSPHVGTHTDAPAHIEGSLLELAACAGALPLAPYIGPALVVDVSPVTSAITLECFCRQLAGQQDAGGATPTRVLLKTRQQVRCDVFEQAYAWLSLELVDYLAARSLVLVGIDTPSVDDVASTTLSVHHALAAHQIFWLENLDLTGVDAGAYFLVALPLKLMEAEAAPVRAVLLRHE
jgi:arylformamidase